MRLIPALTAFPALPREAPHPALHGVVPAYTLPVYTPGGPSHRAVIHYAAVVGRWAVHRLRRRQFASVALTRHHSTTPTTASTRHNLLAFHHDITAVTRRGSSERTADAFFCTNRQACHIYLLPCLADPLSYQLLSTCRVPALLPRQS